MYKEDLALNNLQWRICHKTQQNQNKQRNRNNKTKNTKIARKTWTLKTTH